MEVITVILLMHCFHIAHCLELYTVMYKCIVHKTFSDQVMNNTC